MKRSVCSVEQHVHLSVLQNPMHPTRSIIPPFVETQVFKLLDQAKSMQSTQERELAAEEEESEGNNDSENDDAEECY